MKKFWFHPATIIILVIAVIATVIFLGFNYFGWFGEFGKVGSNGFPTNPKSGDEFTKDGVRYKYVCVDVQCITAPCPPACGWQAINDAPANDRTSKENIINSILNKSTESQRVVPQRRDNLKNELLKLTVEQLRVVNSNQPLGLTYKEICEWVKENIAPWVDCSSV